MNVFFKYKKRFEPNIKKLLVFFVVAGLFFVFSYLTALNANAVAEPLYGWAWAENVGWISFSSTNCDSDGDGISDTGNYACSAGSTVAPYGVFADDLTRELSGQAWSENIGWISFDRTVTSTPPVDDPVTSDLDGDGSIDCPSPDECLAWLEPWTNRLYGWGRAVVACEGDLWNGSACTASSAGNSAAGWDGWIRLDDAGQGYNSVQRDVDVDPNEIVNWAWGGESNFGEGVVGWLSFNSATEPAPAADYAVFSSVNFAPEVDDDTPPEVVLDITAGPSCATNMMLSWTYIDPEDGENQDGYRLQVANDSGFTDIQHDSGEVTSAAKTRAVGVARPSTPENDDGVCADPWTTCGNGTLAFRQAIDGSGDPNLNYPVGGYYMRIQVRDSGGKWSDWYEYRDNTGTLEQFPTPLHPAPRTDFDWTPDPPSQGETITFDGGNNTTFDPTCTGACQIWNWTFQDAVPATSSDPTAQVEFTDYRTKTITLEATDNTLENDAPWNEGTCIREVDIGVRPPLPDFKETAPVSFFERIKGFFSRLFSFEFHFVDFAKNLLAIN